MPITIASIVFLHMSVNGNKIVDELARDGSLKNANNDGCLTFLEIVSHGKQDINALWRVVPVHEWYACNRPGTALIKGNRRCIRMAHTKIHSRHLHVCNTCLQLKSFLLFQNAM